MSRALKTEILEPDWRIALEELSDTGWQDVFGGRTRLVVEIGFGRGEFLMELAARAPETAHVGLEISHKRVMKMCRKLARTDLTNIRILELAAERAITELFAAGSVAGFWVNFPDPWPKKRHARRRLIAPPMVRDLVSRLEAGGFIDLATDHVGYAQTFHEVLSAEPALENAYAPAPFHQEVDGRIPTSYERQWRGEGRQIHYFLYRRRRFEAIAPEAPPPEGDPA